MMKTMYIWSLYNPKKPSIDHISRTVWQIGIRHEICHGDAHWPSELAQQVNRKTSNLKKTKMADGRRLKKAK